MVRLYGYWRSSAAYRLRIALNLKGVAYEDIPINIAPAVGEQRSEPYTSLNPQMRVPTLETEAGAVGQSMAILEWLEEVYPAPPLLPRAPWQRAQCRAFADTIACDIHPLNNLSVLQVLKQDFDADEGAIKTWYADWIFRGFTALEAVAGHLSTPFLFGDAPGLAEICLVPQMWNARRFDVSLEAFPRLNALDAHCCDLPAFADAAPEVQPDAQ